MREFRTSGSVGGRRRDPAVYPTPYGSVAWKAQKAVMGVSPRRYRYTGMERDDETGLQLHGVRYYAPWLGRWCSADPIGLGGGINRFAYARGRPTVATDRAGTDTVVQWGTKDFDQWAGALVERGMLSSSPAKQRAELAALAGGNSSIALQFDGQVVHFAGLSAGRILTDRKPLDGRVARADEHPSARRRPPTFTNGRAPGDHDGPHP